MDSESEELDFDVDPAHVARAALLVARFAAAIQATKELQALQNRPQLLALEKLVYKCIDKGDAVFLKQKRFFRMMPRRLLEKIHRELSSKWRRLPLVGLMANPRTRHLFLHLGRPPHTEGEVEGWSLIELKQLCDDIARECKNSLRSLEIENSSKPEGTHPGLPLAMLSSLLLELRALTSLHLMCFLQKHETDHLISILASTNPDIRSLRLPNLSNKSLCTIADRWPQLEFLQADEEDLDAALLQAVLPKLRNLQNLKTLPLWQFSRVMLKVARAHDPASPPYKLTDGFDCTSFQQLSSEDMIKVFTAFPALQWLGVQETDIPAVCAGLESREHVHITELELKSATSEPSHLEPLLALEGRHLIKLDVTSYTGFCSSGSCVDLNMIGHYCPKLEYLKANVRTLVSGDEFEVIESHFSKLKICHLHHYTAESNPAQLPDPLVCRVLASPTLEDFDTRGVPITEEVVAALAAERERGALSSLEKLKIWYPSTPVSVETLAALVSHAPHLRTLAFHPFHRYEQDEGFMELKGVLTSFVQQGELNVSVKCTAERNMVIFYY